MYHSNRNRVHDLLAGMAACQHLPEIALAMPWERVVEYEDAHVAHPDHSDLWAIA